MHALIQAEELLVTDTDPVICDVRWDLLDPTKGRATYESGHIPGAVFVDLDTDLADPPGLNGRHPLPTPQRFAETLARLGISPQSHVVVYDDVSGRIGARLWWMLKSIGHEWAQVLDGGFQAWEGPIETGWVDPEPADYPPPESFDRVVGPDELESKTVIDVRAGARYRGDHEPVDPKAGHIPGAVNISTGRSLDTRGRFLSSQDLRNVYADLGDSVVLSCGSGVNACHTALAMEVAGMDSPEVYIGSFSEWSRRDLPVTTGDKP